MIPELLAEPLYLQVWVLWLVIVNTASLLFLRRPEARRALVAWLANLVLMTFLFEWNGYNGLLGLSHVVCWTPLLVYLVRRRAYRLGAGRYGRWVWALFWTDLVSLVIDYRDVVRYLLEG